MNTETTAGSDDDRFARSRATFEDLAGWLASDEANELIHADLEAELLTRGRDLLRQLHQDQMDLRAVRERRLDDVVDVDGVSRGNVEAGHQRQLATVVGEITATRLAYRQRGRANLHVADARLNLPAQKHSHGLRRLAVDEAIRGSYDEAGPAIERATGQTVPKRQIEELVQAAVVDFEDFYAQRKPPAGNDSDVLVISVDGKGVVMRPDALRPATRNAAAKATTKLATRLSKGEKTNRKRMATVGAVYDITPVPRSPTDILPADDAERGAAPEAAHKWLCATVTDDPATAIAKIVAEAQRRDPEHRRRWLALVDANNHQIDRLQAEATAHRIDLTVIVDFVHVLEYVWKAAWCFHNEGDPAAETWVHDKALAILEGHSSQVAAAIRRTATRRNLKPPERANADACADYLLNKRPYLDYPTALANGWPIATGVIEGACRFLVKDRMDRTGARWGLDGAEAILRLRAIHANGDLDEYYRYHLLREQQRIHATRYNDHTIPTAA